VRDENARTLRGIADPAARATLIAAAGGGGYRFDVHLQGPHETVFLAI
jgi:protocatechuate 3,4-dioxygenase alpha subunit